MRSAVVAFYNAVPPVSGSASVTYHIARHLPGRVLLAQMADRAARTAPQDGLPRIDLAHPSNRHLVKTAALLAQLPGLVRRLRRFGPDLVLIEGGSWTLYCLAFLRLLRAAGYRGRIVYHAHNSETSLRRTQNGRAVVAATAWAERRLARDADSFYCVSSADAAEIREAHGIEPGILPNGVDAARFDRVAATEVEALRRDYGLTPPIVLFMGLISFGPNRRGLTFLREDAFPRVLRERPDARLLVTGGEVEDRPAWIANPGVLPFERMPAVLAAADVCVAPIFEGSGTRLKILEYLAAGRPVVATAKAAEGLELAEGEHWLRAETGAEFAAAILRLLRDPALARRIGAGGRAAVAERYDWPALVRDFLAREGFPSGTPDRRREEAAPCPE